MNDLVPAARRRKLLEGVPVFAALPARALDALVSKLCEEHFAAGAVVLREGEEGDRLFILARGRAEVSTAGPSGPTPMATLAPGELFGEIALLDAARRRQATVVALAPLTVLSLAASEFESLLTTHPDIRAAIESAAELSLTAKFLKQASPFASVDPGRLRRLAGRVRRRSVAAGETIVRQGDVGDAGYLVRSTRVEVVVSDEEGRERALAILGPGALFGEAALLTAAPRNATVRALEAGEVLVLHRRDLLATMDTAREIGAQMFSLLRLRERPRQAAGVLKQVRTTAEGEAIVILKNPRRGAYFQLSPQGAFLWERLDGRHTLRDLALDLLVAFKCLSPHTIAELVGNLAAAGFLEERALRADAAEIIVRGPWWQRGLAWCRRALQWQIAATGTDTIVARLYRAGVHRLYTAAAQTGLAAIAIGGLATFLIRADVAAMAGAAAAWWFLLPAYLLAIVVHEAGHAFTVKAFGREVPRIGVGWYWFGPVAFVDTSDMWLAGRWPRVAVSLAGPYANAIVAGAAALVAPWMPRPEIAVALWQFSLVSYVLVLVNLCPLLEYDGYYVLMDLLERPNLRRHALTWLGHNLTRALRHPSVFRGHLVEVCFGLGSMVYVALAAGFTVVLGRVLVEARLGPLPPPFAGGPLWWLLLGGVSLLSVWLVTAEVRERRPG
jgi:putative peptide zinc metalloprotease protein